MERVEKNKKKLLDFVLATKPNTVFPPIVSHSSEFPYMGGYGLEDFYHVSLYGDFADSNFIQLGEINAVIENTYLASFCNDLFSCWLYFMHHDRPRQFQDVLSYNFKKFYAEQLLSLCNSNFSRAIFLETLLFEQELMVPVMEELSSSNKYKSHLQISREIATSLISLHELAHLYLDKENDLWKALSKDYQEPIGFIYNDVKIKHGEAFALEVRCDMFAILMSIKLHQDNQEPSDVINTIIYHCNSFGLFYSLKLSAKKTYEENRQNWENETVDFNSIDPYASNDTYVIIPDHTMVLRSNIMVAFCEAIAKFMKVGIYDKGSRLPIAKPILNQYIGIVDRIMDQKNTNARNMALLCARAFHKSPEGMNYLILRSKRFSRRNSS